MQKNIKIFKKTPTCSKAFLTWEFHIHRTRVFSKIFQFFLEVTCEKLLAITKLAPCWHQGLCSGGEGNNLIVPEFVFDAEEYTL